MAHIKTGIRILAAATALCGGQVCAEDRLAGNMVRMFNAFSDKMNPRTIEAAFPGGVVAIQGPVDGASRDFSYEFRSSDRSYTVNFFQRSEYGRPVQAAIFAVPAARLITDAAGQCVEIRPIVRGLMASGWSPSQIERGQTRSRTYAGVYMQRGAVIVSLGVSYDMSAVAAAPETAALAGCLANFDIRTNPLGVARIMTAKPFVLGLPASRAVTPAS